MNRNKISFRCILFNANLKMEMNYEVQYAEAWTIIRDGATVERSFATLRGAIIFIVAELRNFDLILSGLSAKEQLINEHFYESIIAKMESNSSIQFILGRDKKYPFSRELMDLIRRVTTNNMIECIRLGNTIESELLAIREDVKTITRDLASLQMSKSAGQVKTLFETIGKELFELKAPDDIYAELMKDLVFARNQVSDISDENYHRTANQISRQLMIHLVEINKRLDGAIK